MTPHELPPWSIVYQQTRAAGCFEALGHDLRLLLRRIKGSKGQPSAAIFDSRVLQSTPESSEHAGYEGAKRRKGSKVQVAVDRASASGGEAFDAWKPSKSGRKLATWLMPCKT
jgi:hypothetical protein